MPKKKLPAKAERHGPRLRVLFSELTALGPGRAELMERIARTGSISAAAREMGMSYRRAWLLVEASNAAFIEPLVATSTGGSGGGGAQLTEFGMAILARYRAMELKAAQALATDFAEFSKFMVPSSRSTSDEA
ncbi:MAG: LysR family transcriptional regulator [Rhodocyclaceae bacterium]|jgi:molybdate transport system regulatory protein|nr:LysR family transcriptional regulator [Rhodocyclaceae bacterium]